MAYLGNTPTTQGFIPAIDFFSGNGSTTAFTLSRPVASVAQVQATIENVPQNPGTAFTVSGNTITFDGAPPSGTNNIYVYYTSPITQVIQPGQGTVGTAQLQSGVTVSFADGSAAAPSITNLDDSNTGMFFPAADTIAFAEGGAEVARFDSAGNLGVGTSSPSARLDSTRSFDSSGLAAVVANPNLALTNSANFGYPVGMLFRTPLTSGGSVVNNASIWSEWSSNNNASLNFATNGGGTLTQQAGITAAGLFQFNSGYGSVATAYGCRAWVNFNGTGTVAIRGSGNVSSISDINTGLYRVNFSTAMPDTNYGNVFGFCMDNASAGVGYYYGVHTVNGVVQDKSTTALQTLCKSQTGNDADSRDLSVSIFR